MENKIEQILNNQSNLDEKEKQAESDVKKFLESLQKDKVMTADYQLNRILSLNFKTPYELMMLNYNASDEEIKKQYRQLSLLVHPDKCQDPRAADAFHVLESCYKTLLDPDKKKFFQRVWREAKDRIELQRKSENKTRAKKGLPPLPEDNLELEVEQEIKKIIEEVEVNQKYSNKLHDAYKKREREEEEEKRNQEAIEKETKKEWESYRDKRVKNWIKFKGKLTNGRMKGKYETKPPRYKMEERTDDQHIDIFRPSSII